MKEFEKGDVVVVSECSYELLEGISNLGLQSDDEVYAEQFGEEPGCAIGIAKGICPSDRPTEEGWFPLYDVCFTKHADGEWTPEEVCGCVWEEDDGQAYRIYWNPKETCFQVSDEAVDGDYLD